MSSVAYRYAYSLYGVCVEENILEDVYKEITLFYEALNKNEDLYISLVNETIKKEEKKGIIDNIFQENDNLILKNFLKILVEKDRISEIKLIYLDFKNLYFDFKGILNVLVVSVNPLSEEIKEKLKNKLSKKYNKEVILSEKTDKNIIGGLVLYANGKMIDLSVKKDLDSLKRQLKETKIV